MFESTFTLQPAKDFYPCNRTFFSKNNRNGVCLWYTKNKTFWNKQGHCEINRNCKENRMFIGYISLKIRFSCFCWRFSHSHLSICHCLWYFKLALRTARQQVCNQNPFYPSYKSDVVNNDVFFTEYSAHPFILIPF